MITAAGITKSFGDIIAVDSLDFTVNRGEIFGIVGPDGSGKSTLLRMISSILVPDRGSITDQRHQCAEESLPNKGTTGLHAAALRPV